MIDGAAGPKAELTHTHAKASLREAACPSRGALQEE